MVSQSFRVLGNRQMLEVVMIVEVRSYRIKPGRREEFIRFFETRAVPALRERGMKIIGRVFDEI